MTQYYYDFCCRSGGSNLYAGTLTGDTTEPSTSPLVTFTGGTWVQATGVFTVASGNPVSSGVAVGHWVSVYADGASAPTGFVGRVTARDATTITVDVATNYHGTAPTDGTNTRTLVVGGAWAGPAGASAFPINFVRGSTTVGLTYPARVNLKNDQTYNITAAMAGTSGNSIYVLQGYTSTYGDFGKATIDGGTAGASYTLLTVSAAGAPCIRDLIFQNNGATGNEAGVYGGDTGAFAHRVVVAHIRGFGIGGFKGGLVECEAYDCNQSNNATNACGISVDQFAYNCIAHDNTGSNTAGFLHGAGGTGTSACVNCIADTNGGIGFKNISCVTNCDAYNNGSDGYNWTNANIAYCENSNAIKNGGYGFNFAAGCVGDYAALRYGAGTMANTSGGINIAATAAVGETSPASAYAADVHPWVDPANGDFRIILSDAMGTGRGEFTQEFGGFSDVTTMYPDIGAVFHRTGIRTTKRMEGGF